MSPLAGVWAASLTPLHSDLSISHESLANHVRWLLDRGCHGVVLLGTTGEANSFSVEERIALMERLSESDVPKERCIVGTGCCSLPDTIELTSRAVSLGFAGILLLPPFYYKNVSDDGLFDSVSHVIDSVADDSLRIILYHFPRMAGVGYSIELVGRLRKEFGNQIVGVKDSSGDPDYLGLLCRTHPELNILAGSERLLPEAIKASGSGCISATANVTSTLVRDVFDGIVENGSDPRFEQLSRFRTTLERFAFVPVLKHLMARCSGDTAWESIRPPLVRLSEDKIRSLDADCAGLPEFPNFTV